MDINKIPSLDAFNRELAIFIRSYNLCVHSATDSTPMQRFLQSKDRIKVPSSREWLDECFLHRLTRKVRNDATVKIDNVFYDIPLQFIGQTVEIRWDPQNPAACYLFFEQKKYPIRKTNKQENARTQRNKEIQIDYVHAAKGGELLV